MKGCPDNAAVSDELWLHGQANWSRVYCHRDELAAYAKHVADKYGLHEHLRLSTEIVRFTFDERDNEWELELSTGEMVRTRFLIGGFGPLNRPSYPDVPGREDFAGDQFHSMTWDHSVDLTGKRVVSIGTGASAVQYIPEIAPKVKHLTVLQRNAPWLFPKLDKRYNLLERTTLRYAPGARRALRTAVFLQLEGLHFLQMHPQYMVAIERISMGQLRRQVTDRELRAKLTPNYRFSCKRPMVSSNFYPVFNRDNVSLVTERLDKITADGVVTGDGVLHKADVIIWGTGFHVLDAFDQLDIRGVGGMTAGEAFAKTGGAEAYLGTSFAGFPNLFITIGPNGGLAHTSAILSIEFETDLAVRLIGDALDNGIARVEAAGDKQREWTEHAHRTLANGVWTTGGCTTYYTDKDGVNRGAYPGYAANMWWRTRRTSLRDYQTSHTSA